MSLRRAKGENRLCGLLLYARVVRFVSVVRYSDWSKATEDLSSRVDNVHSNNEMQLLVGSRAPLPPHAQARHASRTSPNLLTFFVELTALPSNHILSFSPRQHGIERLVGVKKNRKGGVLVQGVPVQLSFHRSFRLF